MESDDYEATVSEWLGHLKLLHGVPFHYLVSDPRMLPLDSIRFFSVDPNWVDYLVDGACSIARFTDVERAHEDVYGEGHLVAANKAASAMSLD